MLTMEALVYRGPNQLEVQERPIPVPGDGDVRIRVAYAGICGSDIHGYSGATGRRYPDTVMGHEASGIVDAVGAGVSADLVGTAVTFNPIVACDGGCGHTTSNQCEELRLIGVHHGLDGAFADYAVLPRNRLHTVGDMALQQAAMAEPLAVGIHATAAVVDATGPMLIVGAGMIGLSVALAGRYRGIDDIVISDRDEGRLHVARALGFETIRSDQVPARTFERAVDAVAVQGSLDAVFEATRRGAVISMVGLGATHLEVPVQGLVGAERRLIGSFSFTDDDFAAGVELAAKVDHTTLAVSIPLGEAPAAFADLVAGRRSEPKILLQLGATR